MRHRAGDELAPEQGIFNEAIAYLAATAAALAFSTASSAQLELYRDYTLSDSLLSITTVKVKENMIDQYLEGLRSAWISGSEVGKSLGQIEDYKIYVSELPESGEFNVMLVTKVKSIADLAPNRARYDAFMKRMGEARRAETRKISANVYPNIRDVTGEYLMREVTVLPQK